MEKRIWIAPEANEVVFAADNYCASACGTQNTVYKFECNAGSELANYNVFMNGNDGIAETDDDYAWASASQYNPVGKNSAGDSLRGYQPCGSTHEAASSNIFYKGYMYLQGLLSGNNLGDRIDVIVWTENDTNVHCTTNLDMNTWETAKS